MSQGRASLPLHSAGHQSPAPTTEPGVYCCQLLTERRALPPATNVFERGNTTIAVLSATGVSLALIMGLFMSDARGQYYLGGQAGWTGLPSQTDTIDGVRTIPVTFSAGYNVGVRGGSRLGP